MRRLPISGIGGVAGISLIYWICAGMRAAYRPFGYDELVTWYVARLPSVGAIWAAMHQGVDQEGALTHFAVRLCHCLFGPGHLATRLPALTGFWILLLGLYVFLERRLPLPYALIGMVFPMLTFAWSYAFEARAYGVVLGSGAIALVAWQNVAEGCWRRLSLAAIAVSLAIGAGSHAFAVLIAVPLALGEGMRTLERKRLDVWVWLAMAAGALGLLPLLNSHPATRDWDMHGLQPGLSEFPGFYDTVFRPAVAPLLFAVLAACALTRREKEPAAAGPVLPRHESAALIGFVVAPLVFFLGHFVSHRFVFFPRYGLLCVIGVACGSAIMMYRASGGGRRAAAVILAVLVAWLAAARGREAFAMASEPRLQFEWSNPALVNALATGAPVVTIDPRIFFAADYYLPADTLDRLYYVTADRETVRQYEWQDIADQLILHEVRVLPVRAHVETLRNFAARNPHFLLHSAGAYPALYDVLLRQGWRLTLKVQSGSEWIYDVSTAETSTSGAPPR